MSAVGRVPRRFDEGTVFGLIDLIYAAATDAAEWPTFLSRLATTTDSKVASFVLHDLSSHRGAVEWQVGADPAQADLYRHWAPQNVYMQAAAPLMKTGVVLNAEDVLPDREVFKTAFFNDFLRRGGVLHNMGVCIAKEQTLGAILFLLRQLGKPSHSVQEVKLLTALVPHLQRAVAIQRRLDGLAFERAAVGEVLDRLPMGVVMLGQMGKVLLLNRSAETILKQGDGLVLLRDGLSAGSPREASVLRRLIAGVCGTGAQREAGGPLHVSRPSGRRPFSLLVTPLHLKAVGFTPEPPAAAVFVSDPEQEVQPLEVVLHGLFALTPTEARVATLLLRGARVEDVADQLQITSNTARTHLKRVFGKTGTRSQSDLVRVLLTGPAPLRLTGRVSHRCLGIDEQQRTSSV